MNNVFIYHFTFKEKYLDFHAILVPAEDYPLVNVEGYKDFSNFMNCVEDAIAKCLESHKDAEIKNMIDAQLFVRYALEGIAEVEFFPDGTIVELSI